MDVIVAAALGLVVGAGITWLLGRRGPRASFGFAPPRGPMSVLRGAPHQVPPEDLERLLHNANQLVEIDASALRRVIGVGASSVAGGVTLELLAIEVREAGCRGLLRFRFASARMPAQPFQLLGPPEGTVADDLGTSYQVGMAAMSQSDRGGEAAFQFAPPPPAAARRLTVTIERFAEHRFGQPLPPARSPSDTLGPWVFEVELGSGLPRAG